MKGNATRGQSGRRECGGEGRTARNIRRSREEERRMVVELTASRPVPVRASKQRVSVRITIDQQGRRRGKQQQHVPSALLEGRIDTVSSGHNAPSITNENASVGGRSSRGGSACCAARGCGCDGANENESESDGD